MHRFIHFYLTQSLFAIAINAGVMEITYIGCILVAAYKAEWYKGF